MKSFVFVSAIASAVAVQAASSSASAASPTSTSSPLIPSGISSSCASFLTALDGNSTITTCLQPIISATSKFGPSGSSSENPTTSDLTSSLSQLCSSTTTCSEATIRSQLSQFYTDCSSELKGDSSNTDIIRLYDVLYAVVPFKAATCTKDDSGAYCVTKIGSGSTTSASSGSKSVSSNSNTFELLKNNLVEQSGSTLARRATVVQNVTAALIPNTTTFRSTGLPFLLLTASSDSSELCTTCTRSVMTAYMNFEQDIPYAPGLTNSPILGGQTDLYNAITSACGSSFLTTGGVAQAAGGLSNGLISAATNVHVDQFASVGTLFAAVIAGAAALL